VPETHFAAAGGSPENKVRQEGPRKSWWLLAPTRR